MIFVHTIAKFRCKGLKKLWYVLLNTVTFYIK